MSEVSERQLEDMEALFVQTATSMTSDRGTITLHCLSQSTLVLFRLRRRRRLAWCMMRTEPGGQSADDAGPLVASAQCRTVL